MPILIAIFDSEGAYYEVIGVGRGNGRLVSVCYTGPPVATAGIDVLGSKGDAMSAPEIPKRNAAQLPAVLLIVTVMVYVLYGAIAGIELIA